MMNGFLIALFFFAIAAFTSLLASIYLLVRKRRVLSRNGKLILSGLLAPLCFTTVAIIYAVVFAPPNECGSAEAGLCFGIGLLVIYVMPLPLTICTMLAGLYIVVSADRPNQIA